IALWLEANPELTVNDVKEIIAETAIVDDDVINTAERKRWGAGKFNALGGLKEAIRRYENGIRDITVDNDRLLLSPAGNNAYCIFIGTADSIDASVFAADGRRVMQASADGDELTLDLSALPAGIYIINANGKSAKVSVK
ncbi:MAG: S8 family peptidase, partial [Muribaculaceae bacterium]|nr:S8 family peptidase [Muribaculaceae bacterium]